MRGYVEGPNRKIRGISPRVHILSLLLLGVLLPLSPPCPAGAQEVLQSHSLAVASQVKAARILQSGIEAAGGWDRMKDMRTITFDARIERGFLGQNPTPEENTPPLAPSRYRITWDLERGGLIADVFQPLDAPAPVARLVMGPDDRFLHILAQNVIQEIPDDETPPWSWLLRDAAFAPRFLLEAADAYEGLRYLGTEEVGGEEVEVISYPTPEGRERTLSFSGDTGLLLAAELVVDHAQWGSVSETTRFLDYDEAHGLTSPRRVEVAIGEEVVSRAEYTAPTPNQVDAEPFYPRPEGHRVVPGQMPTGDAATMRTIELASGVHQVLNVIPGYNLIYVEGEEGVVVIDAVGGVEGAEKVVALLQDSLPGKLVSALVVTHHHFDHTDGILPFLARGVPMYAPGADVNFLTQMADVPRTHPAYADLPGITLISVEGRTTVGEGPNRFELIDVGPNPHATEILVAYFPEHRLLYVADLYGYVPGYTPPPLLLAFAERLEALGLEVERFATAHTEPATFQEYQAMVQAARAQAGGGTR